MTTSTKVAVVLLVGAEGDAPHTGVLGSESTPLAKLMSEGADAVALTVISLGTARSFTGAVVHERLDDAPESPIDRVLRALGAYALRERFDTFPVGRLLNSLGPVAPSRVFWRALKQSPAAMQLLRDSDVAIASDLESTKAAWLAVHRGWVSDSHYDHRAIGVLLAH